MGKIHMQTYKYTRGSVFVTEPTHCYPILLENYIQLAIDSKQFDCIDLLSPQLSPVSDHFLFALIHT